MRVTRQVTIEEVYELPDTAHPKTAVEMLRKSEEWGRPYQPVSVRTVRKGRWRVHKDENSRS